MTLKKTSISGSAAKLDGLAGLRDLRAQLIEQKEQQQKQQINTPPLNSGDAQARTPQAATQNRDGAQDTQRNQGSRQGAPRKSVETQKSPAAPARPQQNSKAASRKLHQSGAKNTAGQVHPFLAKRNPLPEITFPEELPVSGKREDIANALIEFSMFCESVKVCGMWGNGAAFDNVLLSNAYRKLEMNQPWKFWNDRCYRTVKNIYKDVEFIRSGTHHNAVDDTESQALQLIEICKKHNILAI